MTNRNKMTVNRTGSGGSRYVKQYEKTGERIAGYKEK